MATQQEVIKAFMNSLDNTKLSGEMALDEAVKSCSNFTGMQNLIDSFLSDCKNAASGDDFLKKYCGIVLENEDTGAITGYDAGNGTVKTAESVVPENGSYQEFTGTSFTKRGLTLNVPSNLSEQEQSIVNGLYSWWLEEALKLIEESYGMSFQEDGTTVKEMTLAFETNGDSGTLAYVTPTYVGAGTMPAKSLQLTINMAYFSSVDMNDPNGKGPSAGFYLDRTLAHELTHAVMAANTNYNYYMYSFVMEGLAELVHGIDDERRNDITTIANDYTQAEKFLRLDADVHGDGAYSGGYMLFRYLAYQAGTNHVDGSSGSGGTDTTSGGTDTTSGGTDTTSGGTDTTSGGTDTTLDDGLILSGTTLIVTGEYSEELWLNDISVASDVKVVDATRNNEDLILAGNSQSISIKSGNGENSLWGGSAGDNTLTGGSSRDQFWYGGEGKDVVTNFKADNDDNSDVIVMFEGNLSGVSRSNSTITLNMATGNTMNLETGSNSSEDIILYSSNGNNIFGAKIGEASTKSLEYDSFVNYFQLNGGGTINVTGNGENNIWLDGSQGRIFSGISNITATGEGRNTLAGSWENNLITGGAGTSSLWGGSGGNDTLIGGSGIDIFWFGRNDASDIINDASSADVVNLYNIALSDISEPVISGNKISVACDTVNHLEINSTENLSPTFFLSDGSRWKYNHQNSGWQNA